MLTDLEEVDLVRNAITLIRPFPQLVSLEELWLNDCQIADLGEVRNLSVFPALKTVYLERNPMQQQGDAAAEARYKQAILQAVPHLTQLDALHLNANIRVITDGTERQVMGIRKA